MKDALNWATTLRKPKLDVVAPPQLLEAHLDGPRLRVDFRLVGDDLVV